MNLEKVISPDLNNSYAPEDLTNLTPKLQRGEITSTEFYSRLQVKSALEPELYSQPATKEEALEVIHVKKAKEAVRRIESMPPKNLGFFGRIGLRSIGV